MNAASLAPLKIVTLTTVLLGLGCRMNPVIRPESGIQGEDQTHLLSGYAPVQIKILGPTRVFQDPQGIHRIEIFVSILDVAGSSIKYPGTYRFELYRRLKRSADPRGKRILILPDISLIASNDNNQYWDDFIRCYVFQRECDHPNEDLILQATFILPNGDRMTDQYTIEIK